MKLQTMNVSSPIEIVVTIILVFCLSVFQTINVNTLCNPIAKHSNKSKTGPQIQLLLFWSREYVVIVSATKPIVKIVTIHSVVRLYLVCCPIATIYAKAEFHRYSKFL